MRMHSTCGKCSPNLIVGALLIFSVIVLYNYWTVSTVNRDLLLRLHALEQQAITLSKSKEALQSSIDKAKTTIDKAHEEKSSLQLSLQQEEAQEADLRQRLLEKERSNKDLQIELELAKKSSQILQNDFASKKETSQNEISELKEKVVSLEAQVVEKTNTNEELQEQLELSKKSLDKAEKLIEKLKLTSPPTSAKSTQKVDDPLAQPVLLNDPAVSYPDGWMDKSFSQKNRRVGFIRVVDTGLRGASHPQKGPVILLDPPTATKSKARFSVLDLPKPDSIYFRPEQQMSPDVSHRAGLPSKSEKLLSDANKASKIGAGAPVPQANRDGVGVLPIPGAGVGAENLDAAEDDGDHPLKEDGADQSPDGTLSAREIKDSGLGVGPAPPPGKGEPGVVEIVPGHGGQSGQDVREAAHLSELSLQNNL